MQAYDWKSATYEKGTLKRTFIKKYIEKQRHDAQKNPDLDPDDAFLLFDFGDVIKKYGRWVDAMPRVTPFFAVKCNPDRNLVRLLSWLNTGFDCASKGEIKLLTEEMGVHPDRIINANTWKQSSHIKYAADQGVLKLTFDCVGELKKVKILHPNAHLVLRLSIYDKTADLPFGIKFGCKLENAHILLDQARKLQLNIVGVSFHIGSGSRNPGIFDTAIGQARQVFDMGAKRGFDMNLLDIGGGWPGKKNMGSDDVPFQEFAKATNEALAKYFPDERVKVISEPGRYFNESAGTLVTCIHGKRKKTHPEDAPEEDPETDQAHGFKGRKYKGYDYFVNDGIFATFGRNMIDYGDVPPFTLDECKLSARKYETTVYGDTCAEMDYCNQTCKFQEHDIGDWIYYEDIGAYSAMCAATFNGFKPPQRVGYILPLVILSIIEQLMNPTIKVASPPLAPWEYASQNPQQIAEMLAVVDKTYSLNE